MSGWPFFVSVTDEETGEIRVVSIVDKVDQWLGNLFYRGQQIDTLINMTYAELKYWNGWHEIISKAEGEK